MAKDDKKLDEVPIERAGPRPDFSIPPARKKLPKDIQDTLDSEEKMWETMYEGKYVHQNIPSNVVYPSPQCIIPPAP
jgi:fission process protein 1